MTKATTQQVRDHYEAQGYEVQITEDGHVTYRKDDGEWLEGRWISEYRVIDGNVHLS